MDYSRIIQSAYKDVERYLWVAQAIENNNVNMHAKKLAREMRADTENLRSMLTMASLSDDKAEMFGEAESFRIKVLVDGHLKHARRAKLIERRVDIISVNKAA